MEIKNLQSIAPKNTKKSFKNINTKQYTMTTALRKIHRFI